MAKRHYIADSAILLPSSPMLCVRSDVTGGSFMSDPRLIVDGMSLSSITPSID